MSYMGRLERRERELWEAQATGDPEKIAAAEEALRRFCEDGD